MQLEHCELEVDQEIQSVEDKLVAKFAAAANVRAIPTGRTETDAKVEEIGRSARKMITNQDPRRYRAAVARLACGVARCRQYGTPLRSSSSAVNSLGLHNADCCLI